MAEPSVGVVGEMGAASNDHSISPGQSETPPREVCPLRERTSRTLGCKHSTFFSPVYFFGRQWHGGSATGNS
eukprot:11065665-Prorocentrum_lima.AAC.1